MNKNIKILSKEIKALVIKVSEMAGMDVEVEVKPSEKTVIYDIKSRVDDKAEETFLAIADTLRARGWYLDLVA